MTLPQIRTVVFDVGGVLVVSPLVEFDKVDVDYGLRPGTAMSCFRGGSLFVECETGKLGFAEFCAGAVAEIEADQGIAMPAERLATMMNAIMGNEVDDGMRALVLELEASGLSIGVCSNIYRELDGWLRTMLPPGVVRVLCPSYEVGLRKPDPEIYRTLVEMCAVPAEQIVFVDDFPENVAGAAAAGIHAILFTGEAQLRDDLAELGLAVKGPKRGHHPASTTSSSPSPSPNPAASSPA